MTSPKSPSSDEVYAALRTRYALPEHVLLAEVRDAAGFNARRTVDALAMSVYPSRGLRLTGFEIKVCRSDWRRELKAPEKAEAIAGYCDAWFVVAPAGFVPPDELPPPWGLQELRGSRLITTKPAGVLAPRTIDRSFLATLLRAATVQAATPIKVAEEAARARGYANGLAAAKGDVARAREEKAAIEVSITEFERASGIRISSWRAGHLGEAVRIVLSGGLDGISHRLDLLAKDASEFSGHVAELRAAIERERKPTPATEAS